MLDVSIFILYFSPIILLYTENPSAQDFVGDMKFLYQIALFEHPNGGPTSVLIRQIEVDECEAVQIIGFCGRYRF